MTRRSVGIVGLVVIGFGLLWVGYREVRGQKSEGGTETKDETKISYYTCPMHHQIHADHPGECPICQMKLVPVYQEGKVPVDAAPQNPSVIISPERQQLIGVKTETAQKKQVTKEIRTVGRIAFDPELAIAQREFVEIAKDVPALKSAAMSRLRLLGMGVEEIRALAKRGRVADNLYLPEAGESVWIYATLYPGEMDLVGMSAEISLPSGSQQWTGTVRGIDPVVDPATRSVRARIEVPKLGGVLRPNTYVNVRLKVDLGEALTIPKSALIDTGERKIAYVAQAGGHFAQREIKVGAEAGEDVVILDGVQEGEPVVTNAAFLVDSESRLKATAEAPSTPSCPEGQKWDVGMAMCM